MNLQSLINIFLKNPEFIVIAIVILSSVFNFINNSGKQLREAQRRAAAEEERRRRGFMLDEERREADPDTQSYDGYLKRTEMPSQTLSTPTNTKSNQEMRDLQADILEALGMGTQPATPATNPQEELRRKLAEKMGRTTTMGQTTVASSAMPQAPLGRGMPPPPAPAGMLRPPVRPDRKPIESTIESNIEVYLEQTRPEVLGNDSLPDSLGHSKRQPHFDLPNKDPRVAENAALFSQLAPISRVNEVRGKAIVETVGSVTRPAKQFINPKNAAEGIIWSEILERPLSMRRR